MRLMSMMGLAKRYGCEWAIPMWYYARFFENEIPQNNEIKVEYELQERVFNYDIEWLDKADWKNVVIDMKGFFQSPKYFNGEKLVFKKDYVEYLTNKYKIEKPPLAISIRNGKDWNKNKCYYQLTISYYLLALEKFFPDWEQRRVFVFTDDWDYARNNFGSHPNVSFIEAPDIEQLCVLTLCSGHIISQSTFSYVGAYLSNSEKVIRPIKNFDGAYAIKNDEKDFWPDSPNWIAFDYKKELVK